MIVIRDLRAGTHSASAILHEARNHSVLRHVVRTAPRRWWQETTARVGRLREVVWVMPPPSPLDPPGWHALSLSPKFRRANAEDLAWAKQRGYAVRRIALADPDAVFLQAARQFGLSCFVCGAVSEARSMDTLHFCGRCHLQALAQGGAAVIARALRTEARNIMRDARDGGAQ
jgi:hypothetical protein